MIRLLPLRNFSTWRVLHGLPSNIHYCSHVEAIGGHNASIIFEPERKQAPALAYVKTACYCLRSHYILLGSARSRLAISGCVPECMRIGGSLQLGCSMQ